MSSVKERPILFSGPMVRAIREGHKTQTRRVIKPQPLHIEWFEHQKGWCARVADGQWEMVKCPYGKLGDRLWVRETWYYVGGDEYLYQRDPGAVAYREAETLDRLQVKWRPSIFMPRWASRITLEITDVRVQRLQDISGDDCIAEGAANLTEINMRLSRADKTPFHLQAQTLAREDFKHLWQSINGKDSWDTNPWVWALTFKRVKS